MKKRLLFALMAMCVAVSGFALSVDEYVYTPQGRFLITSQNVASSNFADFTGWTVVSATEGKTIDQAFNIKSNGYAEGMNSAQSLDATAGEGISFKFEPSDAGQTYVVSYKMKGAAGTCTRIKTVITAANLVKVYGVNAQNEETVINTAETLSEDWQTFNYAIEGDGTARTYYISFTGIDANIEIADLQIAVASQVADLRQRDVMIEKMEAYKNCYEWSQEVLDDYGFDENLNALKTIGDESNQAALDEIITTCKEVLDEFLKANMDDYLAGSNRDNYFDTWRTKWQKQSKIGDWTVLPAGRGFWESNSSSCPDLGHYAGSQKWGDMTMGVYMQKELSVGSYVFAIEGKAAYRENNSSSTWENNDGLKIGIATTYIVKIVDGEATDTIASVIQELDPVELTPAIIAVKIAEEGTYEIGYKVINIYPNITAGGVTYVANASLWGKNDNKYNQKELAYEADVREQITTGRDAITKANDYLVDETMFWGKDELKDSIKAAEEDIAPYEAMSQDDIIATYDEAMYVKDNRTKNAEEGLLVYEVYDKAVRGILAANKKFELINDTLKSMQAVIDAAEATLALRLYDAATGKDDLKAAIDKAKGIQAQMQAAQYDTLNAQAIVAANAELNEAVEEFKKTIPADKITEIISLDFSSGATYNEETGNYDIQGVNTVMSINNFTLTTPEANEKGVGEMKFELGIDSNGEKLLSDVLRVGNGSATATIPAKDYGTNILKVSMDFWFLRLSDGLVGFDLLDENSERVAGLYWLPYNNNIGAGYDDFAIGAYGTFFPSNTTGDVGSCADNNKSHIEAILDYGAKSMYLVSTIETGMNTTEQVEFSGTIPTQFVVKSNYKNYIGRRCWFDNLKIEQITAGAYDGIADVNAAAKVVMPKKVIKNGRIVINGKYGVNGIIIR